MAEITAAQRLAIEQAVAEFTAGRVNKATARLHAKEGLRAAGMSTIDSEGIDDILTTNSSLRLEWRHYESQRRAVIIDSWPAQELIQVGFGDDIQEWREYWVRCGGRMVEGRMIALRNDPVWAKMSEFGFPFPPFIKASGMRTELVTRTDAMRLRLIDPDTKIELPYVVWNHELILW